MKVDIQEYINTLPHYHKHAKQGHIVEVLEYDNDSFGDGHFHGKMKVFSSGKYDTVTISVPEHVAYLENGELIDASDAEVARYLLMK